MISIHPDAVRRFNEIAEELVSLVRPDDSAQLTRLTVSGLPDLEVSATISTEDIVGEIEMGKMDATGRDLGQYFEHEGRPCGLGGTDFKRMIELVESIQRQPNIRDLVSAGTVRTHLFAWMKQRFKGSCDHPMVDFVLPLCDAEIANWEVWVPIAMLRLPCDLPLGAVVLKRVTREVFDQWEKKLLSSKEPEHKVREFTDRMRRRLQGYTAGVVAMRADPKRVEEIAIEQTERSLEMLRIFSPASLSPEMRCYCQLWGKASLDTVMTIHFGEGDVMGWSEQNLPRGPRDWPISETRLSEYRKLGLDRIHGLLGTSTPTPFEQTLLDAASLFSRVSVASDLSDKVVYALASLEGLLLKSDSEPIQQNLAERMATLLGRDLIRKREIIASVKAVYGLRSRFLHHAHRVKDIEKLGSFMLNAWACLMTVLQSSDRYRTKEDFLRYVDDVKLS